MYWLNLVSLSVHEELLWWCLVDHYSCLFYTSVHACLTLPLLVFVTVTSYINSISSLLATSSTQPFHLNSDLPSLNTLIFGLPLPTLLPLLPASPSFVPSVRLYPLVLPALYLCTESVIESTSPALDDLLVTWCLLMFIMPPVKLDKEASVLFVAFARMPCNPCTSFMKAVFRLFFCVAYISGFLGLLMIADWFTGDCPFVFF